MRVLNEPRSESLSFSSPVNEEFLRFEGLEMG